MQYPKVRISTQVTPVKGGMEVMLQSDAFARAVCLSLGGIDNFFSDNYFDLLPGEKKTVTVTTTLSLEDFKKQLTVISYQ